MLISERLGLIWAACWVVAAGAGPVAYCGARLWGVVLGRITGRPR